MTALYELTDNFKAVLLLAEDSEIDQQMILDTLESIEGEITEKAQGIVGLMKNITAQVPSIDAEIERLGKMKKQAMNRHDSLKNYLLVNMQKAELDKIKGTLFNVTKVKGRQVVEIVNADALPAEYIVTKTTKAPDKKLLLTDLKAGKEIENAKLSIGAESLRIS